MMTLHCHIWLVLLASIISQCGAIEYYVKPTDFTNVTCPGQPCLTINEYTNASAYYIKSNTAFKFLPGKHIVLKPFLLRDVENVSLTATSSDTKLAAQFTCTNLTCTHDSERYSGLYGDVACCSVISLVEVVHASINLNIEIVIFEMNLSVTIEITVRNSSNVHIQVNVFSTGFPGDGVQTSHCSVGLQLLHTNNTIISNSVFANITELGVLMFSTDNMFLRNITVANNENGMKMFEGTSTKIEKVKFICNRRQALHLKDCWDTHIADMYASYNNERITFHDCVRTTVVNIVSCNQHGLAFQWGVHIYIRNITLYQITNSSRGHYNNYV